MTGTGNELDNVLTGNGNDNTLTGLAGNDTLDGGTGVDTLSGGTGNDTYIVDDLGDLALELSGEGVDTVKSNLTWTLGDNLDNLTLTGSDAIDGTGNALDNVILGNAADNTLVGLDGNDTLDGGAGADVMLGGTGNDIYVVDNPSTGSGQAQGDAVIENIGEGVDWVKSGITYTLTDNVENLTLTDPAANSGSSPSNIDGSGNVLDNVIIGNSGDNTLTGLEGNDTLDGGKGADIMLGGLDDDSYVVDNAGDVVVENAGEGTDTVQSGINYALTDNIENLTLTGTAAIDGAGNALDNVILGNSGSNTLDGGAGADTLAGGAGNDTYIVDNALDAVIELVGEGTDSVFASVDYVLSDNVENLTLTGPSTGSGQAQGDVVTEALNAGIDTVQSSISYLLGSNVENLTLTGIDAVNGTGNTLNNTITGNAAANVLDGGAGADSMAGGMGDDTYIVDSTGDVVTEALNAGIDTVQSAVTYALGANVENLTLTGAAAINGTGNALVNTIIGNNAANVLDGGLGADTLQGGAGDDTYIVDDSGDAVVESANAGTDSVQSSVTYTLSDNVENLTLTGTAAVNGTGNALDNVITGNSGVNLLAGLGGNDTYYVDNTDDVTVEDAGAGNDSVFSTATYTLADNVENITLTGTANIDATGNTLDNALTGNGGANRLEGGSGADSMAGGAGDDTYFVDNVGDIVVETANAGTDTVQSSISYTLTDNVENLVLTGADAINATGNALNNAITGNDGNNLVDGGNGADTLIGGTGDDTYIVDNGNDVVVEDANSGIDTVIASVSYALAGNIENLGLSGSAHVVGTGNTLDNVINGNDGNNLLYGMEGDDALDGGGGADTLSGGAGNDIYLVDNVADAVVETANAGIDTVQSGVSYAISDNVENLALLGTTDINATGNLLDNILTGNGGANVLDGGAGADTLIGGQGDDTLLGGAGNDYYLFNPGDGADIVVDALGSDTLYIGGSLAEANLEGFRDGDDMIVKVLGTTDSVTLVNWFVQGDGVNRIEFDDGSSLDRAGIEGLLNRPPVANPDAVTVFEDGGAVDVPLETLLANDTDPNANDTITVVGVGASAIGATVSLIDGQVLYDIGDRFQELGAGQTVTDSFEYTISDSKGETATSVVNVTITGVNDAPVTAADVAVTVVQEDLILAASGNVLDNDSDVDQGTVLTVADAGVFGGSYGNLTLLADGSYTYVLDNDSYAVQSLAVGQIVTETFDYLATDGLVATPSTLTVTVSGANDAPVTAVDTVAIQEDLAISASGNVLDNDNDVDQGAVLSVVDAGVIQGSYGQLTLSADGSYTYNVDNTSAALQSLGRTAQVSEHFGYIATDGIVDVASALDVSINGTNDAPILAAPLADQDFTFNKSFSWQMPSGSFTDIDQGDTLDYSATLADGSPLPDWLNFDPVTQTFSGMAPKTVGYVDIQVTATDSVAATGSTDGSLAVSDTFRISISHGNEGVGNGEDAAPAGHESNLNDGSGTSPGNPGAKAGNNADNILLGSEGDDSLTGGSADDLLDGSGGNDRLKGGAGNDIYLFDRDSGVDTVIEKDASAGNTDVLRFGDNVADDQIWFSRAGSDLEISFIGTDDKVIIDDWYKGSAYHVEEFQTADGKTLLDSQVENLVSAMAAFSPPPAGQATLPQNYQDALAPVLAANWK
jgi:VCBS repeat-containing protein